MGTSTSKSRTGMAGTKFKHMCDHGSGAVSSTTAIGASHSRDAVLKDWIEVWDYVGGTSFRGFVSDNVEQRAMFVFLEEGMVGNDLKNGLMALIELASAAPFECDSLVLCLDRDMHAKQMQRVTRDLGWVGFGLATLDSWGSSEKVLSARWLFLSMDV